MRAPNPIPAALVEQWHPSKNTLDPTAYTAGSKKKVWWICAANHEWEAQISARVRGNGCPYCSGRLVLVGVNDLATVSPTLAAQWHPTKNGNLTPQSVARFTAKRVWWLNSSCGHEWEASVINREDNGACGVCAGRVIQSGVNDLATLRPEILPFWHPTKNGKLDPAKTAAQSNKKVWWICPQGHERQASVQRYRGTCPVCEGKELAVGTNDLATIHPDLASEWSTNNELDAAGVSYADRKVRIWTCPQGHDWEETIPNRISGAKCPVCAGRKVAAGFNDLVTTHPHIAAQWHPSKNGSLSADAFMGNSYKYVWWQCELGHEWEAQIYRRVGGTSNCPTCQGMKVESGFNDLATTHPEIAAQWHPVNNGALTPSEVVATNARKVWWQCERGHEWESTVNRRAISGEGCPFCANRRLLAGFNDLATTHPDIAAQWHPSKNGSLTTADLMAGTAQVVWWQCERGHEWDASPVSRAYGGQGCPLCSGRRVVAGVNDLALARPDLAKQWHSTKNGAMTPSQVSTQSNHRVWWKCDRGHEWEAKVQSRTLGDNCPYCANKKVLPGYNDLATLRPDIAAQWHPTLNGDLTPAQVTPGSSATKVWWVCAKGHEWATITADRIRGIGCMRCAAAQQSSLGERELAQWVQSVGFTDAVVNDRNVLDGKELDIYIPSKKIAIEFNGLYWHSERFKNARFHYDKWLAAKNAGIQLIQIWEDEWMSKPELVKSMLAHKLGVSSAPRVAARKTTVQEVDTTTARAFYDEHHIQGFASASHYVALYAPTSNLVSATAAAEGENDSQTLVALLGLRVEASGTQKAGNIVRYATSASVIGGFTKLLAYVERNLDLDSIYTFSDHCVSDGRLYESNGFTAVSELAPDYSYLVGCERKHKFGYRLERFRNDPRLEFQEGMTERELAQLNGLDRIWDAGKTKWERKLSS